jgi:hypothetical protein
MHLIWLMCQIDTRGDVSCQGDEFNIFCPYNAYVAIEQVDTT